MNKIEELRGRTYNEAIKILSSTGRVAVIRPTGFGKSWMNIRISQDKSFERVLYMYPADVVKDAALHA